MSSAEPADVEEEVRPGLRSAVAAFKYRNFALFWTGAVVSNTGGWVQNVTVPFVVFRLTDSAAWVGFASFSLLITASILGPVGGTLADRFDRRSVLLVMSTAQAAVAMALWAAWSGGRPVSRGDRGHGGHLRGVRRVDDRLVAGFRLRARPAKPSSTR